MTAKVFSGALAGLETHLVEVETAVSYGLKVFEIVGLGDRAIEESKERIQVALKSSGFKSPSAQPERVIVNLAPASLKKEGSLYDLPIALSYLLASKQISCNPGGKLVFGELSLDGKVRPIRGALLFSIFAQKQGFQQLVIPKDSVREARVAAQIQYFDVQIVGVETLEEAAGYLCGKKTRSAAEQELPTDKQGGEDEVLLSSIKGQRFAKRALLISAAGLHHILLKGPPGTGKTILAKSLVQLLPKLCPPHAVEVTQIYSVAGLLNDTHPFISAPPFRSPHHTSSEAGLIGGGNPPRPGEITLAHRGILFLDEFPEFHRDVLESLRQPMEEGQVTILRSQYHFSFPAKFTLVAAANPCPCGYYRDPQRNCSCSSSSIKSYRRKLSGPLMDRIDLAVEVPQITYEELAGTDENSEQSNLTLQIQNARLLQEERLGEGRTNGEMTLGKIKKHCRVGGASELLLSRFVNTGRLSPRGYHKVLKVARTIADLEESTDILPDHVSEALSFRFFDE